MTREEYIEKINSILIPEVERTAEWLVETKRNFLLTKELLETATPDDFLKLEPDERYLTYLKLCNCVLFYPDKIKINQLAPLGIPQEITQWFIPINEIFQIFGSIRENHTIVLPSIALNSIESYLMANIRLIFMNDYHSIIKYGDKKPFDYQKEIKKIFRRRREANGEPKTFNSAEEIIANHFAKMFEENFASRRKAKGFATKLLQGSFNGRLLNPLVCSFIPLNKVEQTEFLYSLRDIFMLVAKGVIYETEQEWIDKGKPSRDNGPPYGNNYRRYVAYTIKTLTKFDPKTDDVRQILFHELLDG